MFYLQWKSFAQQLISIFDKTFTNGPLTVFYVSLHVVDALSCMSWSSPAQGDCFVVIELVQFSYYIV